MFSLDDVVISKQFANLFNYINPLSEYYKLSGSNFKSFVDLYTIEYIIVFIVIVALFPNSLELSKKYLKFNIKWAFIFAILLFSSFFSSFFGTTTTSEFLYFNF